MIPELIVTAAEMRTIESEEALRGNTSEVLMERAGKQVARNIIEWFGAGQPRRALVLAGPGNNGGDGLVVARLLSDEGWDVRCLTWGRNANNDGRLQQPLKDRSVPVESIARPFAPRSLDEALQWCTVIVDGLLGTGIQRDVEGELADLVTRVAGAGRKVVAVDIPTGVDSDTGQVRGVAIPCQMTVTLGHLKFGHVIQPGAGLAGRVILGDIGLNDQLSKKVALGELLTDETVRALLPARPDDANKGTFGKAMIVAGSINYIGAAALASEGAMRSGAGLVTLACAIDLLPILAGKLTETTYLPLPSDMGVISERAADSLRGDVEGYASMLIGCGIGKDKETVNFIHGFLTHAQAQVTGRPIGFATRVNEQAPEAEPKKTGLPALVLDGDALNILSEWDEWTKHVPEGSVLTPHPGEMARLVKSTVEDVQKDRVNIATKAAAEWKQVVVLKGAGTLIAEPGGKVFVSPFSNPALATAGSGDVLAGAIAGLIAQGLSPVDAAKVGVYLHGLAGELLREEYGPSGGISGDLPVLLARAQKRLREA